MINNDLAHKIFNALFDDEDLNEMHNNGFIAQPLGYQISSVATIELELDSNHDRMVEEVAELREMLQQQREKIVELYSIGSFKVRVDVSDVLTKSEELLAKLNQVGEE